MIRSPRPRTATGYACRAMEATLEITDRPHAEYIDRVEVGRTVAGHIRAAFEVDDSAAVTDSPQRAGATVTPWNFLNSRLDGPGGLQLTIFQELDAK